LLLILIFSFLLTTNALGITDEDESFHLYVSGINNIDEAEFDLAIKDFNDAIEITATAPSYYIARSIAYGKTGKYHLGIKDIKKAIELDSQINESYWLLAEYYTKSEKLEKGLKYFDELVSKHPSNPYIYLNRGQLQFYLDAPDKALEDFQKSTQLDSNFKYGYTAQGAIYISKKDYDNAEKVLLKAIAIDKSYPEPYLYLSYVYKEKGDEEKSSQFRQKAIKLKPPLELVDISESLILRGKKVSVKFMTTTLDLVYMRLLTMEQRDLLNLPKKHFIPNAGVGSTTINSESYYALRFEPEVLYKNFGMQLSFKYLLNKDGDLKKEELDHHKIIQRLRIGREYGPALLYIGNMENISIGYGFIVRNYMNRIDEDEQRIGGRFIFQTKRGTIGIEGIINDIENPTFYAGRFYFGKFGKRRTSFLQRFELGFTFATDIDPDLNPDTPDSLTTAGADILMYLGSRQHFSFALFAEGAQIQDYGSGAIGGLLITIGSLNRSDTKFQIFGGIIQKGEDFEPAIFDSFYESEKYRLAETSSINTTSVLIQSRAKSEVGQFYLASFNIKRFFQTNVEYQAFPDVENSSTMSFTMFTLDKSPIDFYAIYIRSQVPDLVGSELEDFNTYIEASLSVPFLKYFKFFIEYKKTYIWDETIPDFLEEERTEPNVVFSHKF
ncbi:hypothetical protein KAU33_01530, partial [Candidatus Dependentiae bacterium]|nr:hypothetical protein [Candidatus Dependentiae bacterium]